MGRATCKVHLVSAPEQPGIKRIKVQQGSSPSVSTFFLFQNFCYQIFKSDFFLSLTFPISLSDFTIELLSKKSNNEIGKLNEKKNLI